MLENNYMICLEKLRKLNHKILVIGSVQSQIVQSILDFDYLSGKKLPSVVGVLASGRKRERYFWGADEIFISRFKNYQDIAENIKSTITLFLNMNSGRRVVSSSLEVIQNIPSILGGAIFAENVPEKQALDLYRTIKAKDKIILGPASVGLLIPEIVKLGPIGGLTIDQFLQTGILEKGDIAVFSASGGMVGEIMSVLAQSGHGFSFCLTFGGDRFPITTPYDAFLAAENDPSTKYIVYYGELGGDDEYLVADLVKTKKITKKVICYIAGTISEMFTQPVQFGHAKAMAKNLEESASAKRNALRDAGVIVAESFEEFVRVLNKIPILKKEKRVIENIEALNIRKKKMFVSSISTDRDEKTYILGKDLLERVNKNSFAEIAVSMFLGREIKSKEFVELCDFIFKLLVDNGPYQSGVVNTIVAARAGRDMVSSISSGLLTIGSRFGGATNEAARNWFTGAKDNDVRGFVESFAKKGEIIPGIGHLKFRVDLPDPRVVSLTKFADRLPEGKYVKFAKEVEKITLSKKGNLILNVDGMLGALLLDYLSEFEKLSEQEIERLFEIEFFNAFFVLPRTVGFISHFLDQKRMDEGLFRLSSDDVGFIK